MPEIRRVLTGSVDYEVVIMPEYESLSHAVSFCLDLEYRLTKQPKYNKKQVSTLAYEVNKIIYVYDIDQMKVEVHNPDGAGCILLMFSNGYKYDVIADYNTLEMGYSTLFSKHDTMVKSIQELM